MEDPDLRIAYVITRGDEVGGAQIHVRDLCRWLQARGDVVRVFVGSEGNFTRLLKEVDVEYEIVPDLVREIAPIRDTRALFELRRALIRFHPDLVSLHSSKAGVLGRLACASARIPCIFTAHGWAFADGIPAVTRIIYGAIEFCLSLAARRVVTVCEADRTLARRWHLDRFVRIVTIHNGVHDQHVPASVDPLPVRLVMAARFEPQKDHRTLIAALKRLRDLDWHLDLIGDGALRSEIESSVRAAGLEDRVTFMGRIDDVRRVLRASHVFVLASRWEGFPRSILEAMSEGLPVVASDVAGVHESVLDGETGRLVAIGDADELAACLRSLVCEPELRSRMGMASRKRYLDRFTFERMAQETRALYQETLMSG